MARFLLLAVLLFSVTAVSAAEGPPHDGGSSDGTLTIEEFLQKLSTVPGVLQRKDPFGKIPAPFLALIRRDDVALPQSDLERYDLDKYNVTAVLLGDEYNRALVQLPANEASAGKRAPVMIVRTKDRLGNRGGVITSINRDGIVVQQNVKSARGVVDRTVVTLPVGGIPASGQ